MARIVGWLVAILRTERAIGLGCGKHALAKPLCGIESKQPEMLLMRKAFGAPESR